MTIVRKIPWTSQPATRTQLDYSHRFKPIQALVPGWDHVSGIGPGSGAGRVNSVGKQELAYACTNVDGGALAGTSMTVAPQSDSRWGSFSAWKHEFRSDSTGEGYILERSEPGDTGIQFADPNNFCVAAIYKPKATGIVGSSDPRLYSKDEGNQEASHDLMIGTHAGTGGEKARLRIRLGETTITHALGANAIVTPDEWHLIAGGVSPHTVAGDCITHIRCVRGDAGLTSGWSNSTQRTGEYNPRTTTSEALFGNAEITGNETDGELLGVFFFDRMLSYEDCISFFDNPWQIFEPQTRLIPVEVAAAQSYGVIPRQVPWTKQPPAGTPIDWGNPLTRGLFRANIPSGPYSVNLVSGRISAPAAGTHSTGVSRVGKVQYGSSTASQTNLNPYATDSIFKNYVDNVFTMACLVYLPDNYASPAMVFGEGVTSSSSSTSLVRTVNFTDAWEVRFRTSFAGPIIVTTDDAVDAVTGGTYLIVASLNRNAPTDKAVLDVYRLDTGAQERVTSTEDVTNDFTGYNSFAFGFGDDVGAALQLTWNRELTKAERDSLAENPWQTFQPQTRQIPITFGAAAAAQSYGVISRQVPWTKQPIPGTPLDWGNPLTEGLVACWVFNEPTDNLTDLARSHTVNTASGNLITTPQGHAHDFAGAVDRYIIDHDPDLDADADFTIVVGVTNQESGQNIEFIEKQGGNPMYQLYNNASGNRVDFHGRDSAGTLMTLSGGTGSMPVGEFVNIAGVKSVGEDWLWLYVDGELADDQQDTTTGDWSNTADLFIGDGSGSGMFNGSIHYVYIFRTAKKSSQIKSLHENPWQIFQPQTRQIIIEYDAVTGGVVITNVNTTNTWDDGDTGLIITGTGFRG